MIVGVNSNGIGETYGAENYFARVSGVREWIARQFPGARFAQ